MFLVKYVIQAYVLLFQHSEKHRKVNHLHGIYIGYMYYC